MLPSSKRVEIQDMGSLHHYRTEIPNIIFQMKLDPWAFKAYCVFKMTAGDKGSCFKCNNTLSEEVGCSTPTLIKLKKQLEDEGLIIITKRKHENGGDMPDLIQIVDLWPQNMHVMSNFYPRDPEKDHKMWKKNWISKEEGGGKPDLGGGVNAVNEGSKPGLHKQEHKQQEKKEQVVCSLTGSKKSLPSKKSAASEISKEIYQPYDLPLSVQKFTPKGAAILCSLEELFRYAIVKRKSWLTDEINEAWSVLCSTDTPINDWMAFIEGVIGNIRNKKTSEKACLAKNQPKGKNYESVSPRPPKRTDPGVIWGDKYPEYKKE